MRAFPRQHERRRLANAPRRAGDKGDLSVEFSHLHPFREQG